MVSSRLQFRAIVAVLVGTGIALATLGMLARGSGTARLGDQVPKGYEASNLVFSDTFQGHSLDGSKWNSYITSAAASGSPWNGNGRGGSGAASEASVTDLAYDLPDQVQVDNGLRIDAERMTTSGVLGNKNVTYPWRSGAVSTYGHFELTGGYIEVDASMPVGPGVWPGLFMLPGSSRAGKSDNEEIDLFEGGYLGKGNPDDQFAWHVHSPTSVQGGVTDVGTNLSSGFNEYGLDWVPGKSITWYFNGSKIAELTSSQIKIPDEPMELILDVQMANEATGSFHSVANSSTPGRLTMVVKSVQVYSSR